MCTLSWVHEGNGYQVLFNRDEKRTRRTACGPRLHTSSGVRYLAPVDGDFGGTWLAANEFGISLGLLNGANLGGRAAADSRPAFRSRGHLVGDLISAESTGEVCERVQRLDLEAYAPFTLAAFEPGVPCAIVEWNGQNVAVVPHGDPFLPLLSSSFNTEEVRRRRREEFQRTFRNKGRLDVDALWAFHSSHGAQPSAYSPCMHRPDAETVSFSWLTVDAERARLFYSPGSPCRWSPGEELSLDLR